MIRTKKLNTWFGAPVVTPEQLLEDPGRYEDMSVVVDELVKLPQMMRAKQERERAVRGWFDQQARAHPTYGSYRH